MNLKDLIIVIGIVLIAIFFAPYFLEKKENSINNIETKVSVGQKNTISNNSTKESQSANNKDNTLVELEQLVKETSHSKDNISDINNEIKIKTSNTEPNNVKVKVSKENKFIEKEYNKSINKNSIKKTKKIVIYFIHNTKIKKDSIKTIEQKLYPILNNTNKRVLLTGYSDASKARKKTNFNLSVKRALKVKQYLIELGINPNQILTNGKGATNFIDPKNPTDIKNRRVIAEILK